MKKFKAAISTILLIIVLITVAYITRTAPLDREGTPIIPAIIGACIFSAGFWVTIVAFYKFMSESKSEKATNSAILDNLKLNPLPKILDLWEIGTFITKEMENQKYLTFRFYVNGDLLNAVFVPKYEVTLYQKAIIDMGYKETKEPEKTNTNV